MEKTFLERVLNIGSEDLYANVTDKYCECCEREKYKKKKSVKFVKLNTKFYCKNCTHNKSLHYTKDRFYR